jgi:hypothetical protein
MVDVVSPFGVLHSNLDELFHRWIVSVVVVFVRIEHLCWNLSHYCYDIIEINIKL